PPPGLAPTRRSARRSTPAASARRSTSSNRYPTLIRLPIRETGGRHDEAWAMNGADANGASDRDPPGGTSAFLVRFFRLAAPFFTSEERVMAWTLLIGVL